AGIHAMACARDPPGNLLVWFRTGTAAPLCTHQRRRCDIVIRALFRHQCRREENSLQLSHDLRSDRSDAESELDAAALTGLRTAHIVRPGTDASIRHPVHTDLTHFLLEG